MTRNIYAIIDTKAEDMIGNYLMLARNHQPMVRMFTDLVKDPQTGPGMHPEDFTLVQLGVLNDDMTITSINTDIITGSVVRTLLEGAVAEANDRRPPQEIPPTPDMRPRRV